MLQIYLQSIKGPSAALQELYFHEICLFLTNYLNLQKINTNKTNWQQQRQFGANFWL